MSLPRRIFCTQILKVLLGFSAVFASRTGRTQWIQAYFSPSVFADSFKAFYGNQAIIDSTDIQLKLPASAENGAVVPITISSDLEQISQIAIWVEKNPTPLAATVQFSSNASIYLTARIKMAESCNVIVIAKQGERLLKTQQWVNVMQGGCGTG
jgi:sulfur-oxidizing protein SoxY